MSKITLHTLFLAIVLLALPLHVVSAVQVNVCDASGACVSGDIPQSSYDDLRQRNLLTGCTNNNCGTSDIAALRETFALMAGQTPEQAKKTAEEAGIFASAIRNAITWIFSWILSLPVTLSAIFLYFGGTLFDHSIAFTISNFSANYNAYFAEGVDAVWASFRDVGNIVMIGVFVYIAFRVILNVESLQMKGFAARLVIVAVLINFSLFFAKVIVDVSNITATQFLRGTGTTVVNGNLQSNITNIGYTFMQRAGVQEVSLSGAAATLRRVGADNSLPMGAAFQYVILTTVFFLAVGSVLLHGAILMVTRMIGIILLMITSSLAWVSFMTPKLDKFWGMWWDKMFKYALFAPLYTLLLWAVLMVTQKMGSGASPVLSLTTENDIFTATIKVAFIVGLLYGATKIADELAIYGAKSAKGISMKAFGVGLAGTGMTSIPALMGRGVIGSGSGIMRDAQAKMAASDNRMVRALSDLAGGAKLNKTLDGLAKSQFQLRDAKFTGGLLGKKPDEKAEAEFLAKAFTKKAETQAKDANKSFKNDPEAKATVDAARTNASAENNAEMAKETGKIVADAVKEARVNNAGGSGGGDATGTQAPKPNIMEQMARGAVPPSKDASAKAGAGAGETAREAQKIAQVAENIAERTAAQNQKQPSAKDLAKAEGNARLEHILSSVLGNKRSQKPEAEQLQENAEKNALAAATREIAKTNVESAISSKSLKEAILKQINSGGKNEIESALGKIGDKIKDLEHKASHGDNHGGGDHGDKSASQTAANTKKTADAVSAMEHAQRTGGGGHGGGDHH